jgi:hypothetical protein
MPEFLAQEAGKFTLKHWVFLHEACNSYQKESEEICEEQLPWFMFLT